MITRRTAAMAAMTLTSGMAGGLLATLSDLDALAQSDRPLAGDAVRLTDRQGRVRAGLGMSGGNQEFTYFYMIDRNGQEKVRLIVGDGAEPEVVFGQASPRRDPQAQVPGGRSRNDARVSANPPANTGQGQCGAASFAQIKGKVTGKYRGGGGDKADNLQELAPPRTTMAADLRNWLNALNGGLLGIVRSRFGEADMRQFTDAERNQCAGGIYCQLAFRQQAIAVLSGATR